MFTLKKTIIAAAFLLLAGCSCGQKKDAVYYVFPEQAETIALQNLKTRVVVYCSASSTASSEDCARMYEKNGYVRLTNIPSQPADKDFLKGDTYPTRRWRNDELVPRW